MPARGQGGRVPITSPLHPIVAAVRSRPGPDPIARRLGRWALGGALLTAGVSHLTVARDEFRAQVPGWFPVDEDFVVLASGVMEVALGGALVALPRRRVAVGLLAAAFFVVIFPGNVAQYVERVDAFGLDSDRKRLLRLPFQAALVALALWSTGAARAVRAAGAGRGRR